VTNRKQQTVKNRDIFMFPVFLCHCGGLLILILLLPRILLLRSTALYRYAVTFLSSVDIAFKFYCLKPNFVLFHPTDVATVKFYCPVRAALTFVGCDKSKQKRALIPRTEKNESAVAVKFSVFTIVDKVNLVMFL
jgi:hypothetical protein